MVTPLFKNNVYCTNSIHLNASPSNSILQYVAISRRRPKIDIPYKGLGINEFPTRIHDRPSPRRSICNESR